MSIAGDGPLVNVRVIDFSMLLPGPYATWLLGRMDAEVIKIEPPGGDPARTAHGGTLFHLFGRGKQSVVADLKQAVDRTFVGHLLETADIVVEGYRPGGAERLGIGYERVQQLNPRIIYCSIRGFPADSPSAASPGHDVGYLALAGALDIPGSWSARGRGPTRPALPVADLAAGAAAAQAILGALILRQRTGVGGRHLEVSLYESVLEWTSTRAASLVGASASDNPHLDPANDIYRTRDGRWLTVAAIEPKFWRALCDAALDLPPSSEARNWDADERRVHGEELEGALVRAFAGRTQVSWIRRLKVAGVPSEPVRTVDRALSDAWLARRAPTRDAFSQVTGQRGPAAPALDADGPRLRSAYAR
jgi:crotonobetainyl-CoA:carnitine CoA-transferase CaiB-like acyl-CoA transferase